MLKFGISKRDITPEISMCIPGYYEKRFVSGVLDPLYAKAAVYEADGVCLVNVVCDTINLRRDDVLRIRRGISEAIGTPEGNISVSASHTHTGGPSWDWFDAGEHNPIYINRLIALAIEAAREAFDSRVPAKIGFTAVELPGYAFIRRFKMKNGRYMTNPGKDFVEPVGTPDHTFTVGKVCDENGKILAFLTNYGVHLDMLGIDKISADYPGVLARLIEEKYGAESMFFTGPCGNTNHFNPMNYPVDEPNPDLPAYERTGHALFRTLCAVEGSIVCEDASLTVSRAFLSAELRKPTKEYLETAQRFLQGEDVRFMGYGMEHLNYKCTRHISLGTIAAYENPIRMIDVEVQAMTVGDTALVFWPAEVFVEYGKAVRAAFPDKNVIIAELTNGSFACYLPTEDAIEQGGYEPTITGATTPHPKIGTDMVNATVSMLQGALK